MFYSATVGLPQGSFYDDPAYYPNFPKDAIEISDELYNEVVRFRPVTKMTIPDENGLPMLIDIPILPPSYEEVDNQRRTYYADPIHGSDRYFAEATRMKSMGEGDWEAVRSAGIDRYKEIKRLNPWPLKE